MVHTSMSENSTRKIEIMPFSLKNFHVDNATDISEPCIAAQMILARSRPWHVLLLGRSAGCYPTMQVARIRAKYDDGD
jgi:hypothetical protein